MKENEIVADRKTRKLWKSRKSFSEFSYFRVFNIALQSKSKTRI